MALTQDLGRFVADVSFARLPQGAAGNTTIAAARSVSIRCSLVEPASATRGTGVRDPAAVRVSAPNSETIAVRVARGSNPPDTTRIARPGA